MTKEQAESLLRRIASSGSLPDSFDVRIAEVCHSFLFTEESFRFLTDVRCRNRLLFQNTPMPEAVEKGKK